MSIITINTPFNIDLEFKIASFGKRFMAWLIDVMIISLYFYIMLAFIYPMVGLSEALSTVLAYLVIIVPVLLYQLTLELVMNGQTLGKKIVGIKVIDTEGNEPTIGQYITRWILCLGNLFIYVLPYALYNFGLLILFLFIYLPDVLSVLISKRSQRISDFAAGTVVIDKNYKTNISETIYLDIAEDNYKPMFPEVMRLTDRDINGIRNLIYIKRPTKDTDNYMVQVVDKIKRVLNVESDMYAIDFLQQLLKDYNYLTRK